MYGDYTKKSRYHQIKAKYNFIKIAAGPDAQESLHLMKIKKNKTVEVANKIEFRAMTDDEYGRDIDEAYESHRQ